MIRDPHWLYAYWELNAEALNGARSAMGEAVFFQSQRVLRVYDITDVDFDGGNANSFFDIHVGEVLCWYVHVPQADRAYCSDIGFLTPDGRFFTVVRSNVIRTPRNTVSEVIDENWMAVEGLTYFDKMFELSGGFHVGLSSGELAIPGEKKALLSKMMEGVLNLSSGELVTGLSSASLSSPVGGVSKDTTQKRKGFWLVADTELIVYGQTESDATLTVCGRPVQLTKDGSFCLRFALPDGKQFIPVEAVNKDGDENRKIEFQVDRKKFE
jgi:hypothetical protein